MISLSQRLVVFCERYSGLLYHTSPLSNALQMLQENRITAQYGGDTRAGAGDFISLSRSRTYWYLPQENVIRFVLDGTKLAQRYTLTPFTYFQSRHDSEYELYVSRDIQPLSGYLLAVEISPHVFADEVPEIVRQLRERTMRPIYYHRKKAHAIEGADDPQQIGPSARYLKFLKRAGKRWTP